MRLRVAAGGGSGASGGGGTAVETTLQTEGPDLDDFVAAYSAGAFYERKESERFKSYTYDEIAERAGFNLDIWADVKDESLEDAASLPAPEVIAEEIVENLTGALAQFQAVAEMLSGNGASDASRTEATDAVEELLPDNEHRI
jgi:type I restriction enzyme M protein